MLLDRESIAEVDDDAWRVFNNAQQDKYGQVLNFYEQKKRDTEAENPRLERLERRIKQLEDQLRATREADMIATENLIGDALGIVARQLADRISILEKRPTLRYVGNHADGVKYCSGEVVSLGGSMWICNTETGDRPSTSSPAWSLAVKHGRDAPRGPDKTA